MIRADHIKRACLNMRPERVLCGFVTQRRRAHEGRALHIRLVHIFAGQEKVLRASFAIYLCPHLTRILYQRRALRRANVDDKQGCIHQFRHANRAVDRLFLGEGGMRQCVVFRPL